MLDTVEVSQKLWRFTAT